MAREKLDYISNWTARIRSRLYTQFRNKVTWEKWVQLIGRQNQDLEDAGQTLFTFFDIDENEGTQLDLIGRFIGQGRLGYGDPTYRLLLKARVLANKSKGTPENLYAVQRALFAKAMLYTFGGVKTFSLRIKEAITAVEAVVGAAFLGDSKEAGARGLFEWQEDIDSEMFVADDAAGAIIVTGKGFGDVTDVTLGGSLAGAVQA